MNRKKWMLRLMENAGLKRSNNKDFQLWQQHNHPIELSTNEILDQRLDYIHQNPVNVGFVAQAEDWLYSNAQDYAGYQGLLPITILD